MAKVTLLTDEEQENYQQDIDDSQQEIRSGDYWVKKGEGDRDIRLIRSLTVIDNILHSLKVLQHPKNQSGFDDKGRQTWKRQADEYTLEEFLKEFKYIDQVKAKEELDKQIKELQDEIRETSEELTIGYQEGETNANKLLSGMATQIKSDMSLPVTMAKESTLDTINGNIQNTKDIIEKQNKFISEKTAIISKKTNEMALYFNQVAEQSLASIDGTLVFVAKLEQGIHTLNTYLGEGVTVHRLVEGKEASDEEQLTFYQRKLFLDEEWFYNLAEDGGADHSSLPAFRKALEENFSLIDRIAPSQKSIVLMQFRREAKRRGDDEYPTSITEALMQLNEDNADKGMFILVRNGKSIYLIFSDDIEGGERLFPTATEVNDIFRDKKNESKLFEGIEIDNQIGFKDIRNAKAREKFDKKALYYKRIILMMNGIHNREENIFGRIGEGEDWLSLLFQRKNFNFIHDDEDALDYKFTSLSDFTAEKASRLQVGSRVIGLWKDIANEENAGGMWSSNQYGEKVSMLWTPIHTLDPKIVEKDKDGMFIKIECRHSWDSKTKHYKIRLREEELSSNQLLCVDYVEAKEIDLYLNSRKARTQYVQFALLLIGAREMLQEEEKRNKGRVEKIEEYIGNVYPSMEKEYISEKLNETLSFWRIQKGIVYLPDLFEAVNKKSLKEISDIFHKKTEGNKIDEVKEYAKERSINAIRYSTNNKGRFYILERVEKNERIPFGKYDEYPFVWKTEIDTTKKTFKEIKREQVVYKETTSGEEVLEVLEHIKMDKNLEKIPITLPKGIRTLQTAIKERKNIMEKIGNSEKEADEVLRPFFNEKNEMQRKSRKRNIIEYTLTTVKGAMLEIQLPTKDGVYYYGTRKKIHIYEEITNTDMMIAKYASDELFDEMTNWILDTYASPTSTLSELKEIRRNREVANIQRVRNVQINLDNETEGFNSIRRTNGFTVKGKGYIQANYGKVTSPTSTHIVKPKDMKECVVEKNNQMEENKNTNRPVGEIINIEDIII